MVLACILARCDREFVEVFLGCEFFQFAGADVPGLSFADFLKLVGAKIRFGRPKSE